MPAAAHPGPRRRSTGGGEIHSGFDGPTAAPGASVSNLQLNPDGSIRNLNGYTVITGVQNTGREGLDERLFRFALRMIF